MNKPFKLVSIILLFTFFSITKAGEEEKSKLFVGANYGQSLMEFYSFDKWDNWRHDFENINTLGLKLEYSFKKNPNLYIYSNTSYFERSTVFPGVIYIFEQENKLEERISEFSSFILSDFGLKYNINIIDNLSIYPKLGFYYAYTFNRKFEINNEKYNYNEDDLVQNQIGYNVGGGISSSLNNVKMMLEYNYFDTFSEYNVNYKQDYIFWNHIHSLNLILGYEFNL